MRVEVLFEQIGGSEVHRVLWRIRDNNRNVLMEQRQTGTLVEGDSVELLIPPAILASLVSSEIAVPGASA